MVTRPATSPRKPVVVDTDVLIWYLRGHEPAREALDAIPHSSRLLSAVVKMELIHGCRDRPELRTLRRFFETGFAGIVPVSTEISRRAVSLVERHVLAHRLGPADALVAATALTVNASLLTGSVRHFGYIAGLRVLPFDG